MVRSYRRRETSDTWHSCSNCPDWLLQQPTHALFCYEYDPPIGTSLPVGEQVALLFQGVLAECNEVCARSYGATRGKEVIGTRLSELVEPFPGSLDGFFTSLIESDYRAIELEGTEFLEDGTVRQYLNRGQGVVEDGKLIRVWGTFRWLT